MSFTLIAIKADKPILNEFEVRSQRKLFNNIKCFAPSKLRR